MSINKTKKHTKKTKTQKIKCIQIKEKAEMILADESDDEVKESTNFLDIHPQLWTVKEVSNWLNRYAIARDYKYHFVVAEVNGKMLLECDKDFLQGKLKYMNGFI